LKIRRKCLTHKVKLPGSDVENYEKEEKRILKELESMNIEPICASHLINTYGTRVDKIIEIVKEKPSLKDRISKNKPIIKAEIEYMLANEFVETLEDIMIRRTWLNLEQNHGFDCLDYISNCLRKEYEKKLSKEKATEMINQQIINYKEYTTKMEKRINY